MNDKQIGELVIRLFESKCKNYSETTIKVWVDELRQFDLAALPFAIKRAILSTDDFPTIGKILEYINIEYEERAYNLMNNNTEDAQKIAKKAGVNLVRFNNNEFSVSSNQNCIDRFTKVFIEECQSGILKIAQ